MVKLVAEEFDLPVIDIDSLRREAGRSTSPEETFVRLTTERVKSDTWIIDGSYTSVQDIVWRVQKQLSGWIFLSGFSLKIDQAQPPSNFYQKKK